MKHLVATSSTANVWPKVTPPAPLRVLMVVESAGAGTGRHVLDLAEGLSLRGHEVHVAYSTFRVDARFLSRLALIADVRSVVIDMKTAPGLGDLKAVKAVRRYAREHGPFDLIHGHSSKGGAIARLAAPGTRARAIYTLHGLIMMDPTLSRLKRTIYLAIERLLATTTRSIVAVSPEEQRAAVGLGLGEARICMIPNGIAPMELASREAARTRMRAESSATVIGFVGRLVDQKAPHVLIEAFAKVARDVPVARLAMVGDGPLMGAMKALASRLGVADKIIWLGELDARAVFAGFDLFALSSRKEGLPYVVLEALSVGLPVVATRASGVEILVEPGVNGEVVATDDIEAFAAAMRKLLVDRQYMNSASAAARRMAARMTVDAMVEATEAMYRRVVSQSLR